MPKPKPMPSADYLRDCFDYDPVAGKLTWKCGTHKWHRAGYRSDGYIRVRLNGYIYPAHRIIWKWMTGQEPAYNPDHANRDGLDNRWINLRLANNTQSVWNRRLPRKRSLPRGVEPSTGGKWRARIMINKDRRHLGTFVTTEEAAAAYEAAAQDLHGEYNSK